MRELVQVLKAVADRNRIRILKLLEVQDMCVCEIAAVLEVSQPSASKHLSILKQAGLVQQRRNGPWIDHALCRDSYNQYAPALLAQIGQWLDHDPVIAADRTRLPALCREELCGHG